MSAVNAKVHEPSMEEILASIRRIIADDQEELRIVETARRNESTSFRTLRDAPDAQVIPLAFSDERDAPEPFAINPESSDDEAATAETVAPMATDRAAPRGDLRAEISSGEHETQEAAPLVAEAPSYPQDNLLSGAAGACVADAFGRLGATLSDKSPQTMEDFVSALLRPLLRDWLDENLPSLVERLVQAEIERVSRGRR